MASRALRLASALMVAALVCGPVYILAQEQLAPPSPKKIIVDRYPLLAHLVTVQGDVQLVAVVSADGTVESIRVASGTGLLVDPAKEMLSKWRFEPCRTSHKCEAPITFHFVLEPGMCDNSDCPSVMEVDLPSSVTIKSKRRPAIVN